MEKIKDLSDVEVDVIMCRLQGAVYEEDREKIEEILVEVRARIKELKEAGKWHGKD